MKRTVILFGIFITIIFSQLSCGGTQMGDAAQRSKDITQPPRACTYPAVGFNNKLTVTLGASKDPVISFYNDSFAMAFINQQRHLPAVHMLRSDMDAQVRSRDLEFPSEGISKEHTMAQDDKEIHIVWLDEGKVKSARVGKRQQEPITIAQNTTSAAAGPFGAVVWAQKGNVMFICDGMPKAKDGKITPVSVAKGGIGDVQITWNGQFYAVVWSTSIKGGRQIMLQRVSLQGHRLGEPIPVSQTVEMARYPKITWDGSDFIVAWTATDSIPKPGTDKYSISLAVVPEKATKPTQVKTLPMRSALKDVAIASSGEHIGVAWTQSKQPRGSHVVFQQYDKKLAPMGNNKNISDAQPFTCGRPSLVFSGNGYGAAWHDDRDQAGIQIFFSYISCDGIGSGVEDNSASIDELAPNQETTSAEDPLDDKSEDKTNADTSQPENKDEEVVIVVEEDEEAQNEDNDESVTIIIEDE